MGKDSLKRCIKWIIKPLNFVALIAFVVVISQLVLFFVFNADEELSTFGEFFGFSASFISALVVIFLVKEINEQRKSRESMEQSFEENTNTLKTVKEFFEGQIEFQDVQLENLKQQYELTKEQIYNIKFQKYLNKYSQLIDNLTSLSEHDRYIRHSVENKLKNIDFGDNIKLINTIIQQIHFDNIQGHELNISFRIVNRILESLKQFHKDYIENNDIDAIDNDIMEEIKEIFIKIPKSYELYYIYLSALGIDFDIENFSEEKLSEIEDYPKSFNIYYVHYYFREQFYKENITQKEILVKKLRKLNIIFDKLHI